MINFEIEPEEPKSAPTLEIEPATPATAAEPAAAEVSLMTVLPADFPLPTLIKFVPNQALVDAADKAAAYAINIDVTGSDGLQRADVALTTLRACLKAIEDHFEEPKKIANDLHKNITGTLAEWLSNGKQAIAIVGRKVYAEQRRLEEIAAEERRKAQAEADRKAREIAQREADAAAKAQAPAPVVEELKRQAQTATAPPVASAPATTMRGTATVAKWKARFKSTSSAAEPNPDTDEMTVEQVAQFMALLRAIVDERAPLSAVLPNWSYLNKRAAADKSTLSIPGIEAYDDGGVRAKGLRARG